MNAAWAAVVASGVTAVAVFAAAAVSYKAGRRQVKDQAIVEHRHWRRQNRFAAYQQFLHAFDAVFTALDQRRTNPLTGNRALLNALEAMLRAQAAIGLAGPESLFTEAGGATAVVGAVRRHLARPLASALPIPPRDMVTMVNNVSDAQERFRTAAMMTVDNPAL